MHGRHLNTNYVSIDPHWTGTLAELMMEEGILLPYTRATVSLPLCAGQSEAPLAGVGLVGALVEVPHISTLPLAQLPVF